MEMVQNKHETVSAVHEQAQVPCEETRAPASCDLCGWTVGWPELQVVLLGVSCAFETCRAVSQLLIWVGAF